MRRPVFLTRESRRCRCCGSPDVGSDGDNGEGSSSFSVCSGTDGCTWAPLVGEVGDSMGEAVEARRGTQRLCFDNSESILRFAQTDTRAWTTGRVKENAAAMRKCEEFGSAGSQLLNRFCGVRSHRWPARFDYLSLIWLLVSPIQAACRVLGGRMYSLAIGL